MILFVEYLLRGKKIKNYFTTPSSLFLDSKKEDGEKVVLTFQEDLFNKANIKVRKYCVSVPSTGSTPDFIENDVKKENIFTSDKVILKGYVPMAFEMPPVKISNNINSEKLPLGLTKEALFPSSHFNNKINWLWSSFEKLYLSDEFRLLNDCNTEENTAVQRDMLFFYDRKTWKNWYLWKRTFLDFESVAAPELIFMDCFPEKKKKPKIYNSYLADFV